jgi:hypothetical protein
MDAIGVCIIVREKLYSYLRFPIKQHIHVLLKLKVKSHAMVYNKNWHVWRLGRLERRLKAGLEISQQTKDSRAHDICIYNIVCIT